MPLSMLRLLTLFALLLPLAPSGNSAAAAEPAKSKKIIEWGWDEPDTKFMRENIEQLEDSPFDGVVFHASSDKGTPLMWECFGGPTHKLAEFQHAIDDLKATKFRRITDRFLRVNVTPGKLDWFDDQAWAAVVSNAALSAQIAKLGDCKGFMFDTEQYETVTLFNFPKQKHAATKSYADYRAKVRERGREWIKAVNAQFPDILMLLTFGYKVARYQDKEPAVSEYGLLADFLDGVLDACTPQTRIVDAWEFSYGYKQAEQFQEAYKTITEKALAWTQAPDKYRRTVTAGFGIWLDNSQEAGWHVDDFSKNYFSPAQFETSLQSALKLSDEYVWIYSEHPRWWTKEKTRVQVPQAYVDAFKRARDANSASSAEKK